jgi:uncharacterized cupredoxin-like copper-binding protein
MAVIQDPPELSDKRPDAATAAALEDLRLDVHEQARSIRSTQRGFTIFAVMAALLAIATLLAVATKLNGPQRVVVRAAPAPAAPATAAAPLARNVDVTLAQFAVSPSATQAPAGRLTFRVHNAGTITHEFVIIRSARPAADLPIKNGRADEAGNVGETGDLKPGATKSVSFKLPTGHYALICNLPGHYLAGQHTDFTVR